MIQFNCLLSLDWGTLNFSKIVLLVILWSVFLDCDNLSFRSFEIGSNLIKCMVLLSQWVCSPSSTSFFKPNDSRY